MHSGFFDYRELSNPLDNKCSDGSCSICIGTPPTDNLEEFYQVLANESCVTFGIDGWSVIENGEDYEVKVLTKMAGMDAFMKSVSDVPFVGKECSVYNEHKKTNHKFDGIIKKVELNIIIQDVMVEQWEFRFHMERI